MTVWTSLLDLGLGRRCLSCATPGPPWCDRCLAAVHDPHRVRTPAGALVHVAAGYEGAVRSAVLAHKEQSHLALAQPLGRLLGSSLAACLSDGPDGRRVLVVPAPSRRAARRRRGQDHARRLARQAARRAPGAQLAPTVLGWGQRVVDQGGLGADSRALNVSGAMTARPPRRPGTMVVVVDDVVTTGATQDEARRALEQAGWHVVGAAVVASVSTRWGVARATRLG